MKKIIQAYHWVNWKLSYITHHNKPLVRLHLFKIFWSHKHGEAL